MPFHSEDRICYEFDDFRVDPVRRPLLRSGEPVPVTPKALSILLVLLEQPGEVVEKSDLIERVWAGSHVTEANLTQNVFALRKCLGERANDSRYVVTVPGRGYSFAGEVRRIERGGTGEFSLASLLPAPVLPPAMAETAATAPAAGEPPPLVTPDPGPPSPRCSPPSGRREGLCGSSGARPWPRSSDPCRSRRTAAWAGKTSNGCTASWGPTWWWWAPTFQGMARSTSTSGCSARRRPP